jgi:thiosulfate/3-mercaptopyruvate sulfurtransferase
MKVDLTSGIAYLSRKNNFFSIPVFGLFCMTFFFNSFAIAEGLDRGFISPNQLSELPADRRVIIDTRSAWKFFIGHIPDAVNLSDWRDFTEEEGIPGILIKNKIEIAKKLSALGIDKSKEIVIYGDPVDPWRIDGRIYWMLEFYGFSKLSLLDGGVDQWSQSGGAISRGKSFDTTATSLRAEDILFNENISADKNWIKQRLGSANLAIIDNRIEKEYKGSTPYGSPRGGHIPGAKHIDWRDFFNQQGQLKNKPELLSILKKNGIQDGMEVVVYCTGGVRSAMAYFVFKYLGFPVRNYDGSWWDWSHDLDMPIENS